MHHGDVRRRCRPTVISYVTACSHARHISSVPGRITIAIDRKAIFSIHSAVIRLWQVIRRSGRAFVFFHIILIPDRDDSAFPSGIQKCRMGRIDPRIQKADQNAFSIQAQRRVFPHLQDPCCIQGFHGQRLVAVWYGIIVVICHPKVGIAIARDKKNGVIVPHIQTTDAIRKRRQICRVAHDQIVIIISIDHIITIHMISYAMICFLYPIPAKILPDKSRLPHRQNP